MYWMLELTCPGHESGLRKQGKAVDCKVLKLVMLVVWTAVMSIRRCRGCARGTAEDNATMAPAG